MDRVLRVALVAQWLLAAAGTAADLALAGQLPEALRRHAWDAGPTPPAWALAAGLAALALWLAGSVGLWLRSRPARALYAASLAALLAATPALGPVVSHPVASALYSACLLLQGATLALAYASPAAAAWGGARPATPPYDAASQPRLGLGTALFLAVLGALALVGLAAIAIAAWTGISVERAERAAADGRAFGKGTTEAGCLEKAERRVAPAPDEPDETHFPPSFVPLAPSFLDGCLETAGPTPGFCDGVPPPYEAGAEAWTERRCGDDESGACALLLLEVQEHCHRGDAAS